MASPRGTPTKKARVEAPNIAYCVSLMRVHCADIARALEGDGLAEALRITASSTALQQDRHREPGEPDEFMVTDNKALFERMAQDESDLGLLVSHMNNATRTIHLEPDENFQRHALTALTATVRNVQMGLDKSGKNTLVFSLKKTQYFGGWGQGYPNVNTDKFEEAKQKSCVIGLHSTNIANIKKFDKTEPLFSLACMNEKIMKDLTRLVGEKAPQSMAVYGGDFELVFVDILFKYDLHSHFTYHTDDRHGHHPVLAVVVQLTADESSRHVAGAESEAITAAVGEAHVVLCNSYHRSGRSTARTVLAVFFYKQKTRAVAQAQPPEKAVQPSEPKQEEAGSSKPEDEAQGGEEEDGEEEEEEEEFGRWDPDKEEPAASGDDAA